jgi:hypothetical protein
MNVRLAVVFGVDGRAESFIIVEDRLTQKIVEDGLKKVKTES